MTIVIVWRLGFPMPQNIFSDKNTSFISWNNTNYCRVSNVTLKIAHFNMWYCNFRNFLSFFTVIRALWWFLGHSDDAQPMEETLKKHLIDELKETKDVKDENELLVKELAAAYMKIQQLKAG